MYGANDRRRRLVVTAAVVAGVAAVAAAVPLVGWPAVKRWWQPEGAKGGADEARSAAALVPGTRDTLSLPKDVQASFGIRTATVHTAKDWRPLPPLAGSLALDTAKLARVHSRFPGDVVEIGPFRNGPGEAFSEALPGRPLGPGDAVKAGQLLAVVWSKDLGEKKSELVDALSRLRLDRDTLKNLEAAYQKGAVSERTVRQARRDVESDLIAVTRAEQTLRSWKLTEDEIRAIRAEAERLRAGPPRPDRQWARVEVKAPFAGTILEMNVALGDIVDTSTDLFKIADLDRLVVWAHAYEEDLPRLQGLPKPIPWTITIPADPGGKPIPGTVDQIGPIVDPNQHTVLLRGHLPNPGGRLRVGQFITATIKVPLEPDLVEVPAAALVEGGHDSIVFVQDRDDPTRFTLRRVAVARQLPGVVLVRSRLSDDEQKKGLQPLDDGDVVVTAGAVELRAALEDLQAAAGR